MVSLVERDSEIAALERVLVGARSGRGGVVALEGEPGIGKTALLDRARAAAEASGLRVLAGRGVALEQGFAFGVARQLLAREILGADAERRAHLLRGAAHLAEPVLLDAGAPPADVDAAVHGLVWLVTALGDEAPLAVIVDDLHWADASSRRLLAALADRVAELPVALLMATRPVPAAGTGAVVPLHPARLSGAGVGRLVAEVLGRDPDMAFADAVLAATDGTPFLVRAVAEAAARGGVTPDAASAAGVGRLGTGALAPELTRRLGRLAPEAGVLAAALAVAGDGTEPALLAALADRSLDEAAVGLAALRAEGLVAGTGAPAFTHALVRTAVLDGLGGDAVSALHAAAARLRAADGDDERAAAHLAQAPPSGDAAVVDLLERVARAARGRGDAGSAIALLRRALAEPPPQDRRAPLLLRLGRLEVAANDPAGPDRLAAAARAATDPTARLRAAVAHGQGLTVVGRYQEGLGAMRAAIAAAADDGADADAVRFAQIELTSEELPVRASAAERAEREQRLRGLIGDRDEPLDRLALGVLAFHCALVGAPRAEVVALVERALSQGIVLGYHSPAALHPLFALTVAGAPERAQEALGAVVAATRARGSVTLVRTMSAWHAMALLFGDRLADAEQAALDTDEATSSGGLAVARLLGASVRGVLALERGDLTTARALLDTPLEHDPELAHTTFADGFLVARGRLRAAEGDAESALRLAVEAGARMAASGTESPGITQWRTDAAHYAMALGRVEQAAALAHDEVGAATALGAPRPLAAALRACAATERTPAAQEARLREGLAVTCGTQLGLERARLLLALAPLLPAVERRETLREALDSAWRAGAAVAADHARTALIAAGGRPRRAALTGARALTPAETRTARLAATGHVNREIAEQLFLTSSTVEGHLTSAYRKLGIGRRDELAAALGHRDAG